MFLCLIELGAHGEQPSSKARHAGSTPAQQIWHEDEQWELHTAPGPITVQLGPHRIQRVLPKTSLANHVSYSRVNSIQAILVSVFFRSAHTTLS